MLKFLMIVCYLFGTISLSVSFQNPDSHSVTLDGPSDGQSQNFNRFYPELLQQQQQGSIQLKNFNLPNGIGIPDDQEKNLSPVEVSNTGESNGESKSKRSDSRNLNLKEPENNSLFSKLLSQQSPTNNNNYNYDFNNHKNEDVNAEEAIDEGNGESLKSKKIKSSGSSNSAADSLTPTPTNSKSNRELLVPSKIYGSLGNVFPFQKSNSGRRRSRGTSSESLNNENENEKNHYYYKYDGPEDAKVGSGTVEPATNEDVDLGESLRLAWLFNHLLRRQGQGATFGESRDKRNSGYVCHFKLCQFGSSGKRRIFPAILPKVRNVGGRFYK